MSKSVNVATSYILNHWSNMFQLYTLLVLALNCGLIQSEPRATFDNPLSIYISNTTTEGVYNTTAPNYVIDCTKDYYFVTHGWTGSHNDKYSFDIINQFRKFPNALSYYIDWCDLSHTDLIGYTQIDTDGIGIEIAKSILLPLYKQCKTPYVYMFALSMGDHVLGKAGRELQTYGYKVDVIVGADPAGPFITYWNPDSSLQPTDAKQVVVTHTSDLVTGTITIKGKVDFYFNGGSSQPGQSIFDGTAHTISIAYHNESIANPYGFVAYPCYMLLGLIGFYGVGDPLVYNAFIPESAHGDYCLDTNASPPYAQGPTGPSTDFTPLPTRPPRTTATNTETPLTTTTTATTSVTEDDTTTDEYHWDDYEYPEAPDIFCNI